MARANEGPTIRSAGSRARPGTPASDTAAEVRRLGEALQARSAEVLQRTTDRAAASEEPFAGVVRKSFERICSLATAAVAGWMTTGSSEAGLKAAGRGGWDLFGRLVAQRAAPMHEVMRRCLYWRDAAGEVLGDSAERLGVGAEAVSRALEMLQMTVDLVLVRMCEVFETERLRTDEELMRRQEELAFMATHDALTGLPNRTLMLDRGEQMLQRARRHRAPVAALLIDIDNLKQINDTLGHDGGDELLRAVATRLDAIVRGSDALGRIGGDEFVVIADELSLAAGPELIAERLLAALREPFTLSTGKEHQAIVTASIGVAAGDRASTEQLLRDADIAMCRAKWEGKDRFVFFDSAMHDAAQDEVQLEMDLRDALSGNEFFLHYQPTFALRDMSITGMEALIRWRHPARGTIQPGEFIPLLEKSGLVRQVGRWVLGEACRQTARWHREGYAVSVAVNVSARQLDADDLVEEVRDSLRASGLNPTALILEITETTLMSNAEATAQRLEAIKDLGVRVAIDDFGTGYSSLAHLQRFPVDALKIDGSFLSNLDDTPDGEALIHTLVQLGKALSIETVAEGIERHEQISLLRREGCDSGQGYLFAPPMEAEAATDFMRTQLRRAALSYAAQPA